ncbi:MAG: hypothetical protein ACT4P2_11625 [Pseudomonadota bacterium]
MFLCVTIRKKDGKEHRYFSVVENRRVGGGRVVQRHVLYLGEINSSQELAWRKSIEVRNYAAFKQLLPELMKSHRGKFVLLRDEKPVEFFNTARDAMVFGRRLYSDGNYSVQEIAERLVDLGFFSHAVHQHPVRSAAPADHPAADRLPRIVGLRRATA